MDTQEILRTARIMIVDDDDDLRQLLLTQFEREGVGASAPVKTVFSKVLAATVEAGASNDYR